MPHFAMVSAKEILARVIRNTGYKLPSSYHDDILEWIPEGINALQTTTSLITKSTGNPDCEGEILIENYSACLPPGFVNIIAVEDENGRRLPEGGDVTDITSQTKLPGAQLDDVRVTVFSVNPLNHQTSDGTPTDEPGTSIPLYGSDLGPISVSSANNGYYKIQGNRIQTSFEEGYIKIHYLALPTCKDGYPLIPDNEAYKTALYWYILMMLIGAGYEHKVFTWAQCSDQFEKYAARAMNEITYPSLDSMARIARSTVRLIPPYRFHEDFFMGSEQSERLNK